MKIAVLRTYTEDMARIWRSLEADGHSVLTFKYDELPHECHSEIVTMLRSGQPDLIVFIGAIEKYHEKPVPTVDMLKRFHEIAPMVHICPDSVEGVWEPILEEYAKEGVFDAQIGIDGYKGAPAGVVPMLAPVSWPLFKPKPWAERTTDFGFVGPYTGTFATAILRYGSAHSNANWYKNPTEEQRAEFLCDCKFVVNSAWDSTETKGHVTPLVSDVAAAGACLVESMNDATAEWFDRKTDYYEYQDFKQIANIMKLELGQPRAEAKAYAMSKKWGMMAPDFWDDIFFKIGLKVQA